MAKGLLWIFVIVGFIMSVVAFFKGEPVEVYTKVVILSCLAVLSICSSIEKGKQS